MPGAAGLAVVVRPLDAQPAQDREEPAALPALELGRFAASGAGSGAAVIARFFWASTAAWMALAPMACTRSRTWNSVAPNMVASVLVASKAESAARSSPTAATRPSSPTRNAPHLPTPRSRPWPPPPCVLRSQPVRALHPHAGRVRRDVRATLPLRVFRPSHLMSRCVSGLVTYS